MEKAKGSEIAHHLKMANEPDCAGEYGKHAFVHDDVFVKNGADLMRKMRKEIWELRRKLKAERRERKAFASASQGAVARLVTDKMNMEAKIKQLEKHAEHL